MERTKFLLVVTYLLFATSGYSQKTYLKITKSEQTNDYTMYPPGTKFELKNKHGYIVFKNSDTPGAILINENYTLYVYPSWKNSPDKFKLSEGKVEKLLTSHFSKSKVKKHLTISNGVTAEYTIHKSDKKPNKKNLKFKLSNGITFEYYDDKYYAYLNKKENYLQIKKQYIIESEIGTLKLSFNPNSGIVWWVFEENK
ncbi:hypothetical protein EYD45_06015 [Hyunsoonleella flava]|uniref:Uncharacterized protein n=1 Tax=Hyunsoonleella flava TaxID=2527939 RepID=A0A4V2JA86_9FLAO|nr:hypothetical protein [Hyunsoonleella flava]TBN04814.1 hypothetical protein EYD45_06015 [Hyunsoonleella flava]